MVEFKDPPASRGGRWGNPVHTANAEALRARPGEWAICYPAYQNAQMATRIKKGELKDFPQGEFDATARKVDEGKWDIYVRYIGGGAA